MGLRWLCAIMLLAGSSGFGQHVGFDKNEYPGDASLPALRKTFDWTGYWLSNPPGTTANTWTGKRTILQKNRFGFALLFLARMQAELSDEAAVKGRQDATNAAATARAEGFPAGSVIFLDIEEGGRLTRRQSAYTRAFLIRLVSLHYSPGAYLSGIAVPDGPGKSITTARSIRELQISGLRLWIANDVCPPAPGCRSDISLKPNQSGTADAVIWQYAQTPRRPQFAGSACAQTYAADNRCYAPNTQVFIDMNVSRTPDPSAPSR